MPELCFAANLTSAEVAAWVQAVGSVVAIIAAILVVNACLMPTDWGWGRRKGMSHAGAPLGVSEG